WSAAPPAGASPRSGPGSGAIWRASSRTRTPAHSIARSRRRSPTSPCASAISSPSIGGRRRGCVITSPGGSAGSTSPPPPPPARAGGAGRGGPRPPAPRGTWGLGGGLRVPRLDRLTHIVLAGEQDADLERYLRREGERLRFVTRRHATSTLGLLAALRRNEAVA